MAEDGQLIAGRYRLGTQVGSGAMGVVWRAEDETLRRTVALKQVRLPSGVDDLSREQAYRRVMREGRLFARIHHPHAIAVFDVVDHDAQPWLVMEYLPSRSLSEVVAADGVFTPPVAAAVGHQVAAALTAAHTAGIVHRDVKPGNVLLGADGMVKVTDFGISRAVDEATITSTGMMAGTPAYLAPEVARGAEATFRSDVYSLGSTLYAVVEGEPPFGRDENALAQLHRVASGEYRPPRHAGTLAPLLERMLAADPVHRPEMHQVSDELERLSAVEVETEEWGGQSPSTGATVPVSPRGPVGPAGSASGGSGTGPGRVAVAAVSSPSTRPQTAPQAAAPQAAAPQAVAPQAGPQAAAPDITRPTPRPSDTAVAETEEQDAQDTPAPRRRRGLLGAALALLLVGAVVVVALILASGGGGSPTATVAGPTPSASEDAGSGSGETTASDAPAATDAPAASDAPVAPAQGTPDQVAQQQAVIDYYAMIPTNLPEGWGRLTSSYQRTTAGGFAGYSRFWDAMSQVSVRGVSPGAGNSVDATVTYVYRDGRTSEERTLFTMVQEDGVWKINDSRILSSR
ncbi:serine/threonine-protein kinase [Actinomycetospora atypica]|uniref:non-specific serine/threonine protein kinase n=1 Tax=Actinomycetospora atypica TaxID=1290095 RepID=A0ABV9YGZ0_9PSEU